MREGRCAFRIAFLLSSDGGPGLIWAAGRSKILRDLVQKERRYKVLRVIVHQVRAGGWPKTHWDLVQKERSHKGLRVIVHQVRAAGRLATVSIQLNYLLCTCTIPYA